MDPLSRVSIQQETVEASDVAAVLQRHFELMRSQSPEESCHVLTPAELLAADAVLLVARRDGDVQGVGALSRIDPEHGELKSMHTLAEARGQGVAGGLLEALMAEARAKGMTRLSLETGSAEAFAPARALYTRFGFEFCSPFGDYRLDPLSVFMSRVL